MASLSFSQHVQNFTLMADGITARLASLAGINITAPDATAMRTFATELNTLNAEQEDLKAKLKTKTDELDAKMAAAKTKHADLTKRVKIATPQEHWVAFGIAAKR